MAILNLKKMDYGLPASDPLLQKSHLLSIETSCDETSFAIARVKNDKFKLLANLVSSQIKIHKKFGGVVPNLSAREHLKNFGPLLAKTLRKAGITLKDVDVFSVVSGPGLIPALLVGSSVAKTLAYFYKKPLIPINHVEGHIYSAWLNKKEELRDNISFPVLALVVSGGHTQLVYLKDHFDFRIVGETLDDAVGEAFDKVAKILNLEYPGGPVIEKLAQRGNLKAFMLPRPLKDTKNLNFSFSGLKTAVLYLVKKQGNKISREDIAASFQEAVVDSLISKTKKAVEKFKPRSLLLVGGVAANEKLRKEFSKRGKFKGNPKIFLPEPEYCGDNAAMQLPAVYFRLRKKGLEKYQDGWKNVSVNATENL